jgi:ABC-type antimicrobial peptide transport system permease subunit
LIAITHEYGKAIGWQIVQGRDLSRDFPSDSTAVLLNEAAVKFIGNNSPIGMEIVRQNEKLHVIGVVKDMIVESPYKAVRPHIYLVDNALDRVNWINIKLSSEKNAHESIALIESVFKKIIPSVPFQYKFIDDEYAKKFDLEEHIGKLTSIFALLAIVISCLGLFGLASFVAEQKTKEIGIRKVLGASVANLWQMLSKDFALLVLLSCFIAIPIAYYLMSNLLSIYEYHTEISWWVFVASGMGALLITLLTVSFQAIKAAMMNPVNSLKSE